MLSSSWTNTVANKFKVTIMTGFVETGINESKVGFGEG